MNGFNLSDIQDAKLGTTQLSSIYLGSTKLWPTTPIDYSQEYFTIESLEDNNTLSWKINGNVSAKTIYWSTDKTNWISVSSSSSGNTITTLDTGDKIYLKGSNSAYGGTWGTYTYFVSSGKFNVYGNVMSLINNDDFVGKTTFSANFTLYHLFHATKIVDASNLILPATTLKNNCYDSLFTDCTLMTKCPKVLPATTLIYYCYSGMFARTSIVTPPKIKATKLAESCCRTMFIGCASLTTAPELPVTTLATECYRGTFNDCTALTTAPELPATTLVSGCYTNMFKGCTSLNYIKAMFTTTPSNTYTQDWVNGIAASGTFVKNISATWDVTGINGIPSGWVVQTASS